MIFDTEDEVAKWLIQQEEDYKKEQDKMNNAILSDRAGYDVQTEEEWKEILKYHNTPYYPRYPQKRAEETFMALRSYFEDKTERPSFCEVPDDVKKLEGCLDYLRDKLALRKNLSKKQEREIRREIGFFEKKLYIRKR